MHEIIAAANRYRDYAQFMRDQHYAQSDSAAKSNMLLGIPVTLTATIVSTSIFASINSSPATGWKIGAGLFALIAAALAALQTFFKFPEVGERHRSAAAKYGAARRELELFALRYQHAPASSRDDALTTLEKLAGELADLDESSPAIGTPRPLHRPRRGRRKWHQHASQIETGDAKASATDGHN